MGGWRRPPEFYIYGEFAQPSILTRYLKLRSLYGSGEYRHWNALSGASNQFFYRRNVSGTALSVASPRLAQIN